MDKPPGSRLFIVCGSACPEHVLRQECSKYGTVEHVKMLPEKGVAYVKFQVASQAARALETLHLQTLKDGRVTVQLKVLYADPIDKVPNNENRSDNAKMTDPDNHPPRSRLFLVVPRDTSPAPVEESMDNYEGLEYVKTDLVKSKGIIYVKFRLASSALKAKEDIEKNNYMLCGKRVKVFEAEPKCNSPHDDARQDRVQTRPPSKSPQLGSETTPTGTSGMSSPSPFPDIERNPHFMAYLSEKGFNVQQVKDSCVVNRQLQQWFANFLQESGAPPNSMTPSLGDEWHNSRTRYYPGDHKGPQSIPPSGPHVGHPMHQPPAPHMQPPLMQPLGGGRMGGSMPSPVDVNGQYMMPVEPPLSVQHHDHSMGMQGAFAQAGLHPLQVSVPPPGVPYNHKHPQIHDSPYHSHPMSHQGYMPADDFTQSVPIHDNWGHSSQSVTLTAANVVPPSMTTITSLGNPHGPGSGQGHMTTQHSHQPQGSYANVPHSTSTSSFAAPSQGGYQGRWTGVRGSGHSATVPSTNTSISSLDARMSTPVPHNPYPLPPGYMLAPKSSKQLLIMFAISAIPEMQVVEQFTSCVVRAYEGCEKCCLVYGPTSQMLIWYHCTFISSYLAEQAQRALTSIAEQGGQQGGQAFCWRKMKVIMCFNGRASQPLPSQSPHTQLSGSYNGPINLGRNSAPIPPIPPHNSMGSMPMHSYSRSDLLSNSLTMPQRTTSPVHAGGPAHLPAISDTMGSMYTDAPGQGQSTADSKGIDATTSGNNSNKSSSETKPNGAIDSTSSRALDIAQAGGTWPKKGPEVVFFHCTPLRGQAEQIPRAVCDNMFGQCGTVVNITMHPTEIRWGAVTFADSSSAAKLLSSGHQEAFSFKVECIADDVSPAIMH